MKRPSILLAGVALFALSAGSASADCADELARMSGMTTGSVSGSQGGISKDGSLAPLQSGSSGTSGQSASAAGQGVSKDGSTMPLANQPGGGSASVATSGQDAQSQQQGGQTAAAASGQGMSQGSSGNRSPQMMAALERARTLHQQGNEAGCMQAVQEAKRLQ